MREMAALWEGHTLLKIGLSAHRHTDRHSRVKTVYPPVSLRSLGGYNKRMYVATWAASSKCCECDATREARASGRTYPAVAGFWAEVQSAAVVTGGTAAVERLLLLVF